MTALVAADVTVTVQDRWIEGPVKYSRCKIEFGDEALTYPTGGVPLPTYASWGFKRNIDFLTLFDQNDASGYVWKYDLDNHKLLAFTSAGFTPAGDVEDHDHVAGIVGGAEAAGDITAFVPLFDGADAAVTGVTIGHAGSGSDVPWNTSSVQPTFTGTAVAAAALAELDSAVAPAAQVLYAIAKGW